jgi:hypothetical protein
MSAGITQRDRQVGIQQAWHKETILRDVVTLEEALPFEVAQAVVCHKFERPDEFGIVRETIVEDTDYKRLIATDDWLPVGEPYGPSYNPSSIALFKSIVSKAFEDVPHKIISAGSVDNRCKLFCSIQTTDGFRIGDREFKDYISVLDSFDKSTSLTVRYSNVCCVCANTVAMALKAGTEIGKAKHTAMLEFNVQRLLDAIDQFIGTSAQFQAMLKEADATPCSRDEARAWITGIQGRNTDTISNGLKQKTARIVELFDGGRGNQGRTRLDAFSSITEFETHESTNRKGENAQYYTSEFGSSAQIKTLMASRFNEDWDMYVKRGEKLINQSTFAVAG